jgi:DNA-binding response OmpR family regulator
VARVLIVDDDEHIRTALGRLLRQHGWQVQEADCAESAAPLVDDRCSLAIVDIEMPGVGGLVFLRELRRQHPRVRRLMVTSHDYESLDESPAEAFLRKPVDPKQLLRVVSGLIGEPLRPRNRTIR